MTFPLVSKRVSEDSKEGLARLHQVTKVARLYYIEGKRQREIAQHCGISLTTVHRYLAKARALQIVETRIHGIFGRFSELEVEIEKRFGVIECLVASDDSEQSVHTYQQIGALVGELIERLVSDGSFLGVSWGRTLKFLGDHLSVSRPVRANVVPIIGAMGIVESGVYPNAIAASFARQLGGKSYLVNVPAFFDSRATKESFMSESEPSRVTTLWNSIDTIVVGTSDIQDDCSLVTDGPLSVDDVAYLRRQGATLTCNGCFLGPEGQSIPNSVSDRAMTMSAEEMWAKQNTVLVAGGRRKVTPVRSILATGGVNYLVIDEALATSLVEVETSPQCSQTD